ncbi:snapalysin family zinc-dependent metalloprotease [Nocardiopsis trehalosi]|jgi:snapalysin|uniref:snapalysin family zinc-dependent metalloprotease n=1 Tax=Nocardiopsis trehalosi TaxID=109329 RepID=UPI000833ED47|nr:snapalysin family zinc-dependent metalloprotease [Nocardiopsis trehalosi]
MLRRTPAAALLAAAAAALCLVGAPGTATAATAQVPAERPADAALATTLYYDASRATQYGAAITAGARAWNDAVDNVTLAPVPAGRRAEITIVATSGWPQATLGPVRPGGSARVEIGRQAVDQGYSVARIAAHELGHSLGLPDVKPGPCSSLMSGSTGGVGCTSTAPNAAEAARVERNYGGGAAGEAPAAGTVVVDRS